METVIVILCLIGLVFAEVYFARKTQDRYFEKLERTITNALINGSRK